MAPAILIPWLLAGAILAVAAVAAVRARAAAQDGAAQRSLATRLRAELDAERERLAASETKRRRAGEDLAELRHKLDKARKRAARADRVPSDVAASRSPELAKDLEAARQMRDAARGEARTLAEEVARLETALREKKAAKPLLANAEIESLQRRALSLESQLGALRGELDESRNDAARLRQKVKTQEQLYLSIRGELQAKKDRLRTQTEELERLRALEVVLNRTPE